MRARDVVVPQTTVTLRDTVADVVRLLAEQRLPGLVVVDERRRPVLVLPGTQVLRMAVLDTYQQDPPLVRTIDEAHADLFLLERGGLTVEQCLPPRTTRPETVGEDATLLEVAALMARGHCPLVAVVDREGKLVGAITLNALLGGLGLQEPPA